MSSRQGDQAADGWGMNQYQQAPCRPKEVLGWPAAKVLATLGPPPFEADGEVWFDAEKRLVKRGPNGMVPHAAFGLFPSTFPCGQPYRVWTYHHMLPPGVMPPAPVSEVPKEPWRQPPPSDPSSRWVLYFLVARAGDKVTPETPVHEVLSAPMVAIF